MSNGIELGGLLTLPEGIQALVFDMDGVLIDSVAADLDLCQHAADAVLGASDWLRRDQIIAHFALHPEAFWVELVKDAPRNVTQSELEDLVRIYNAARQTADFVTLPGAVALLHSAKAAGLKVAVASSNDLEIVEAILTNVGLASEVDAVAGIEEGVAGKPSPDIYLKAAERLDVPPKTCAFVEDSITGLQAGQTADYGYAIAVATGATSIATLSDSDLAHVTFSAFEPPRIRFIDGQPTDKSI
ncbi:MAG: HAD family phosphatase, partial [Pseudomonadota bacterium]